MGWSKVDAGAFAGMVMLEIGLVIMTMLAKIAMNNGLSNFVYAIYQNSLAILILLPYFIFHTLRRNRGLHLTSSLIWRFFLLGLFGKCMMMFAIVGLNYSSPALAAAIGNLIPIFTFLLAVIFRMEKLDIRRSSSRAKLLGTIVTVSGAFLSTLYKGSAITMFNSTYTSLAISYYPRLLSQQSKWVLGGLFLAIGFFFKAAWNVLQAVTVKEYPEEGVTIMFFFLLSGTIQLAIVTLAVERKLSAWVLHHNVEGVAIVYSAIFGSLVQYIVITWCLLKKGPLYVAMFNPLGMVIAEIGGIIFLGDVLHLGSVIGAIIIAVGFYTVLWGQAKENDMAALHAPVLEPSTETTPLLQSYNA